MANRSKHPSYLTGRDIGIWYARQKQISSKSIEPNEFNLDQKTVERIADVVKDSERLEDPRTRCPPTPVPLHNIQHADEESIVDAVWGDSTFEDTIPELIDTGTGSIPITLKRDEMLDKHLQVAMIETMRSPSYAAMKFGRQKLPAFAQKQAILDLVDNNQVVVISGETGCGKTTQVPQFLLEHAVLRGHGSNTHIVVTQPRRISAVSVADRVAAERGQRLGDEVGYQIRLDAVRPRRNVGSILFCTTGVLLQRFHCDPRLQAVSHVVVDEVHEREMLGDFLVTMLKRILPERPDLRVILMSATLNAEAFSDFFGSCPKLEIPGRVHPVETLFLEDVLKLTKFEMPPPVLNRFSRNNHRLAEKLSMCIANPTITPQIRQAYRHWFKGAAQRLSGGSRMFMEALDVLGCSPPELVAATINHIIQSTTEGAILAFVPGMSEILDTMKILRQTNPSVYEEGRGWVQLRGLHSRLPTAHQRMVFDLPPRGKRKVVIATNIAETSITIEDVVYVVDCGQIKVTTYDPSTNISTLAPVLVSKANAAQRRGRAGRVRPGQCYHLFPSFTFEHVMLEYLPPEITRTRLEDIILRIKVLDLGSVTKFLSSCMDPPAASAITRTLHFLRDIQALVSLPPSSLSSSTASSFLAGPQPSNKMTNKQRKRHFNNVIASGLAQTDLTSSGSVEREEEEEEDHDVLTPLGHHLANLPLDPQCAKLLILGAVFGCLRPSIAVAACLTFKDPFEVPLGCEMAASNVRAEMSEQSQSDHWVYHVVLSEYLQLDIHRRADYCQSKFLNRRTMDDLCRLMKEFLGMLFERRYVTSMNLDDAASNSYSHDVRIFRAVLAGAFYPNIIMASRKTPKNLNGPTPTPIYSSPSSDERVELHNKSVNAQIRPLDSVWLTYFSKMKIGHGGTSTIFDSTLLGARPLIFFSSKLESTRVGNDGLLVVDNWVKFKSGARIPQLVKGLKVCFDKLLDAKITRAPQIAETSAQRDRADIADRILQTIIYFFTNEAPPALDLTNQDRDFHGARGFRGGGGGRGGFRGRGRGDPNQRH